MLPNGFPWLSTACILIEVIFKFTYSSVVSALLLTTFISVGLTSFVSKNSILFALFPNTSILIEYCFKLSISKLLVNVFAVTATTSFTFLTSNDNPVHQFRYEIDGDKVETSTSYLKYGLTLKQMLDGRNIYSTTISPDGDYSLVKYFDCDDNGKKKAFKRFENR